MLSMPPARAILALPAHKISCASMMAFMPEPHILLTVVQGVASGRPAANATWGGGSLALARRQNAAKNQLFNIIGADAGPGNRRLRRHGAKARGGKILEIPLKTANWRARRAYNDDLIAFGHPRHYLPRAFSREVETGSSRKCDKTKI